MQGSYMLQMYRLCDLYQKFGKKDLRICEEKKQERLYLELVYFKLIEKRIALRALASLLYPLTERSKTLD